MLETALFEFHLKGDKEKAKGTIIGMGLQPSRFKINTNEYLTNMYLYKRLTYQQRRQIVAWGSPPAKFGSAILL